MEHLLSQNERKRLLTCYKVFTPRMARLNGLQVTQFDVFSESAQLLDFLLCNPDISQHQMDSLWTMQLNDIRKWKADATDYDKQMVAGTVFMVVRATLAQCYESCYSETVCDFLTNVLEDNLEGCDEKEQTEFLVSLREQSPALSEWINSYDESEEWLSDQISDALFAPKGDKDDYKPSGKTFKKTTRLTDTLINIIGQRLTMANKLSDNPDDWLKLFSGIDQQFTITWLGTEGELRDLFIMLTDDGYVTPKRGYQQILKSHFIDVNGNRFNNLHGAKSINSFKTIIDDCTFFLQHLTDNITTIMKQLISENEDALHEVGYFDQLQAAKRAGLSIKKKRR